MSTDPESFPGSDAESHFAAQERFQPQPTPDGETATPLTDKMFDAWADTFCQYHNGQLYREDMGAFMLAMKAKVADLETTAAALRREVEALRGVIEIIRKHSDRACKIMGTIRTETRPVQGHEDPGAIEDCWREAFDELVQIDDTAPSAPLTADAREGERLAQFFPTNGLIPIWAQTAGHEIAHSKHKRSLDLTGKSVSGVIVRHYRAALAAQANKGTT